MPINLIMLEIVLVPAYLHVGSDERDKGSKAREIGICCTVVTC